MSNGGGYIDLSDRILGEGEPPLFGPGSQLDPDGIELKPMDMPRDMATFEPPMAPEPEDTVGMEAAKARLGEVQAALLAYRPGDPARVFDLRDLPPADLGLVNQLLGEGEVGVMLGKSLRIQESVFAGVWRVLHFDENEALCGDTIEVAAWPGAVRARTFAGAQTGLSGEPDAVPEGVVNAPSILIEVDEKARAFAPGVEPHSINLSLLPHTEKDLHFLAQELGVGNTIALSRGYGNCRVSSTRTANVWWVQYFNSQETLILNSIEISAVPEVVCAAPEDLADSAERLQEVLDVYRNE